MLSYFAYRQAFFRFTIVYLLFYPLPSSCALVPSTDANEKNGQRSKESVKMIIAQLSIEIGGRDILVKLRRIFVDII